MLKKLRGRRLKRMVKSQLIYYLRKMHLLDKIFLWTDVPSKNKSEAIFQLETDKVSFRGIINTHLGELKLTTSGVFVDEAIYFTMSTFGQLKPECYNIYCVQDDVGVLQTTSLQTGTTKLIIEAYNSNQDLNDAHLYTMLAVLQETLGVGCNKRMDVQVGIDVLEENKKRYIIITEITSPVLEADLPIDLSSFISKKH